MPIEISDFLQEAHSILNEEPDMARSHADKALELAVAANNPSEISESYYLRGKADYLKGEADSALEQFELAIEVAKKAGNEKILSASLNNSGLLYFQQSKWEQAISAYTQSLEIKERLNDQRGIAVSCSNIGGVFFQTGNYPEALKYFSRAEKIFEALNELSLAGTAIYNIGLIHSIDKNFEESINFYKRAEQFIQPEKDIISTINLYINLGDALRSLNKFEEAEEYLLKCLELSEAQHYAVGKLAALANLSELKISCALYEETEVYCLQILERDASANKNALVVAHLNLGRVYFAKGLLTEAEQELKEAYHVAKSIDSKHHLQDVLSYLIHVYEQLGNFTDAFQSQKDFQVIREELYDSRIDRKLAEVKFQHDLENKQKEAEIERLRNVELKAEKEKSDHLLRNILPDEVAEELKLTGKTTPRLFENVSVLFTDFVSFTKVSERLSPQDLVNELHECFKAFDEICAHYGIEKIKTIGDAYLAVCGVPVSDLNHAVNAVNAAFAIIEFMKKRKEKMGNLSFDIRIGINSGNVVAGIVGVKKFAYDIWGDTVNTAARMEQNGVAGKVNISEATYELVKDKFKTEYRGEIEAKNKGRLKMYFVSR